MSRRCHHGSPRRLRPGERERRRPESALERPPENGHAAASPVLEALPPDLDDAAILEATAALDIADEAAVHAAQLVAPLEVEANAGLVEAAVAPASAGMAARMPAVDRPRWNGAPVENHETVERTADGLERGATAPQLRRFIKSRAYVPMHELRRRFAINGGDDDVTPIDVDRQRIYVGLPPREGSLLGELLRAGDIGYELSMDPISPIVVGVYPMRPISRG
jgi:hypothetical protein